MEVAEQGYNNKMKLKPLLKTVNEAAYQCLMARDVENKIELTLFMKQQYDAKLLCIEPGFVAQEKLTVGVPDKPQLVAFHELPKRTVAGSKGHAAMIHAFAHIEFNAINIALDAICRFPGLPLEFYSDWLQIAHEEAIHFQLLREYLQTLGHDYGSFPAHSGLWEMVELTAFDVMVRMALVPRVLEARGLDVTPDIIRRFRHHQHQRAAEILEIIYRDEIGHVEIGSKWFNYFCRQRGLDSEKTFTTLIEKFATDKIRQPFNLFAREQAGFSAKEMEYLQSCTNQ